MIVMKFGGSSVESAAAIERVAGIVQAHAPRKPVVVVSAMGKTTNRLLEIAARAVKGDRPGALRQLDELRDFHRRESSLHQAIDAHFAELGELVRGLSVLGELTPRATDAVSAFGERLSSLIVTAHFQRLGLDAGHADARELMVTDARFTQAAPQYEATYQRLARQLRPRAEQQIVVLGGFIGATAEGITTTLGRGGSDFTASIVGAGIGAEEIQIWTDVDGMLTCDPRILPGGHRVRQCSFAEAAELAYFGAKVLHPATVVPAMEKNIPVFILNSRRPEVEGTRITAAGVPAHSPAKSIACKTNITVVNIQSTRMLMAHGFLRRIFEVFDRHQTPVDMVSTSEVSVSLTIDNTQQLPAIVAALSEFAEVTVDHDQAIVCLVGDNLRHTPGVAGRMFQAVREVNIRMISQGASRRNVSFVVDGAGLLPAVAALHEAFFGRAPELDPAVFG
jgi:aspartate kinase